MEYFLIYLLGSIAVLFLTIINNHLIDRKEDEKIELIIAIFLAITSWVGFVVLGIILLIIFIYDMTQNNTEYKNINKIFKGAK